MKIIKRRKIPFEILLSSGIKLVSKADASQRLTYIGKVFLRNHQ